LLSCITISGCDSLRLGVLIPNKQDTLRLLSCIKISGCDSLKYGLIKTAQDTLRLGCNIVTIGNQKWMKENLDVVTYRNGDTIPQVTDPSAWGSLTTGAWCYYKNDPSNGPIYGKLYNFYAVNDPRGLAPRGWHIPTDDEWTTLSTYLGGDQYSGGKMKTTGTTRWVTPNADATNESGFGAQPGGLLEYIRSFLNMGYSCNFWSASDYYNFKVDYNPPNVISRLAWSRTLDHRSSILFRNGTNYEFGFSVRCLKD
jgi:uncharacterized protein (TIGR02145 family)